MKIHTTKLDQELEIIRMNRMHDDLSQIREMSARFLNDMPYSSHHETGPFEVEIDLEQLGEYLNGVSGSIEGVGEIISEMNGSLGEIEEGIDTSNQYLDSIDGSLGVISQDTTVLPEMRDHMRTLGLTSTANLGASLIDLAISARAYAVQENIARSAEAIVVGLDDLNNTAFDYLYEVRHMHETLYDGIESIVEGQRDIEIGLKRIADTIEEGLGGVVQVLEKGFERVVHATDRVESRIDTISRTEFKRRAQEKYTFAKEQFQIRNYSQALKDVEEALQIQSTHVPALLLFGAICIKNGRWGNAKDAFYTASEISRVRKDPIGYEESIVNLANLERALGNFGLMRKLMRSGVDEYRRITGSESEKLLTTIHDIKYKELMRDFCIQNFYPDFIDRSKDIARFFPHRRKEMYCKVLELCTTEINKKFTSYDKDPRKPNFILKSAKNLIIKTTERMHEEFPEIWSWFFQDPFFGKYLGPIPENMRKYRHNWRTNEHIQVYGELKNASRYLSEKVEQLGLRKEKNKTIPVYSQPIYSINHSNDTFTFYVGREDDRPRRAYFHTHQFGRDYKSDKELLELHNIINSEIQRTERESPENLRSIIKKGIKRISFYLGDKDEEYGRFTSWYINENLIGKSENYEGYQGFRVFSSNQEAFFLTKM